MSKNYIARIETDSGTIQFEFESSEVSVKGLMDIAIELAHECVDEAAVFIEGRMLKDFQLKKTNL